VYFYFLYNFCLKHFSFQEEYGNILLYRMSEKDCTLFLFYFSRCPVCGEWCKLHWLLLDTPRFDWNTRRSRCHKIFKMAPTKQQKAFCAVEYAKTTSVITLSVGICQRLMEFLGGSTSNCRRKLRWTVITDVVFAYSTAQNAFCRLVGAILKILCSRERRVFQSKLGVSSSNQCNLHHSPHTGHLEKK
jgi:hypothetical protein